MKSNRESGLLINGRFASRQVTGVERYAHEMSKRMGSHTRLLYPERPLNGFAGHLWEQIRLPGLISKSGVLWSPANTGPLQVQNQVVTIHDLAVIDHPDWFAAEFAIWYQYLLPRLVRRVSLIITPSNFSRERILEYFRLPEGKVIVLPGGVDRTVFYPRNRNEQVSVREKYQINGEYILFVGSIEPRKNLAGLIATWDSICRKYPDISLVIAGGTRSTFRNAELRLSNNQCHFLGYVLDDDLPAIYSGATAYIQPSFYEGFGLSVLEAMSCGVPVLASSAGALPELVHHNGMLFDSVDNEDLAQKLSTLLDQDSLRSELSICSLRRALEFSWESSASRMWLLLDDVLSRSAFTLQ